LEPLFSTLQLHVFSHLCMHFINPIAYGRSFAKKRRKDGGAATDFFSWSCWATYTELRAYRNIFCSVLHEICYKLESSKSKCFQQWQKCAPRELLYSYERIFIFAEMRKQFKCLDDDKIILIFSCKHSQHQDISGFNGVVYICHPKCSVPSFSISTQAKQRKQFSPGICCTLLVQLASSVLCIFKREQAVLKALC
jgi:hypothetical protein